MSIELDQEIYNRRKFIIDNANILEKIPIYNNDIKYILSLHKDKFKYSAPEVINLSFFIVKKCIEISNQNYQPHEWLKELKPFLELI